MLMCILVFCLAVLSAPPININKTHFPFCRYTDAQLIFFFNTWMNFYTCALESNVSSKLSKFTELSRAGIEMPRYLNGSKHQHSALTVHVAFLFKFIHSTLQLSIRSLRL